MSNSDTRTALVVTSLAKQYRQRRVVNDVSLTVRAGEIVGLLVPNGAGKTTCFYMIVGLIRADHGSITLGNEEISHLPIHLRARRGLGYLPQEASIFRKLSVTDNILAILETRSDLKREEQHHEMQQLMEDLHVTHIADSLGMALSGGERRRVEIARALAANPRFILLDEPFAGVDPISVIDIQQIIRHLQQRGIGILITDHNVRETLSICERGYIIGEGHVIASGDPEAILNHDKVRKIYLGDHFRL
ncbi:MAG: LPS export ABC transporter ATP-binding protein [Gammaproteobacteria bacterium]|nr:LPS export ABC transporter ATP-binding protein [Gammaproteobacteria bacterium]